MKYTVVSIHLINKIRYKVLLDNDVVFPLYKSEISKYNIEEEQEIDEDTYLYIMNELLLRRARERALHLLTKRAMTEREIIDKLKDNYYPMAVIEKVIALLKEYRYIDDYGYTQNFVENKAKNSSVQVIKQKLKQKGISDEVSKDILSDMNIDETAVIKGLLEKKRYSPDTSSIEETRKITAFLLRKGFRYEDVRKCMKIDI